MASDYAPTPVEDFLDPDHPTLFPRLTPEQIEYLAEIGTQLTFARGDVVWEHGQRETPLYVVQSGAIDVIDHAPEGDRYFAQCRAGTFAADISMFTGEPTLAAGYAAEPTSLVALPPGDLRRVVATTAELGDLLLRTMVTRREWLQGRGLAGTSARIENYLGFPTGLTGADLARRATLQARKFGAVISSVHEASQVSEPHDGGFREIGLADGQCVRGRCVVLGPGADYRRLPAENADRFEGLGLYYAATHIEAQQCSEEDVVVVGGANSAGQAAVKLADHAREVHVVARRPLEAAMSRYLVDQIEAKSNIRVWTGCEVRSLEGDETLEAVVISGAGPDRRVETSALFAMIGASPRSEGLVHFVGQDDKGFVVTGEEASRHPDFPRHWNGADRGPLMLECTRPGVFAIGDLRRGSTKRVAAAVGDGALVVRSLHASLEPRRG